MKYGTLLFSRVMLMYNLVSKETVCCVRGKAKHNHKVDKVN